MAFSIAGLLGSDPNDPYGESPLLNHRLWFLVGGIFAAIIVIFIAFVVFTSLSNGPRDNFEAMLGKQQFLNTTIEAQMSNIKDDTLGKANSEADVLFTSDLLDLMNQLSQHYSQGSLASAATDNAADGTIDNKLANATLLGTFNSTYRDILHQKIQDILQIAPSVRNANGAPDFRAAMDKYIADLKTVDTNLEALSF